MGKHLHNLSKTLLGELEITNIAVGEVMEDGEQSVDSILRYFGDEIREYLRRVRPETLGRIAAQGTLFYTEAAIDAGIPMPGGETRGKDLLIEIACRSIITEMNTILTISIDEEIGPVSYSDVEEPDY